MKRVSWLWKMRVVVALQRSKRKGGGSAASGGGFEWSCAEGLGASLAAVQQAGTQ